MDIRFLQIGTDLVVRMDAIDGYRMVGGEELCLYLRGAGHAIVINRDWARRTRDILDRVFAPTPATLFEDPHTAAG